MTPTPHQPDSSIDIEALRKAAPRVEACIAEVESRFHGESKAAQARYFEEVHQHLAPLARSLERELAQAKAETAAAWEQLREFKSRESGRAAAAAGAVPEGFALVPKEPTEEMWSGLARDIVMAWRFNNWTPKKMADFMESTGHDVPDWLRAEPEMGNAEHTISKGTCAVLLYKAMLAAAPPAQGLPAAPAKSLRDIEFDGPDDPHAPAPISATSLKELCAYFQESAATGSPLTLSSEAATAMFIAMTTPPAAAPSEPVLWFRRLNGANALPDGRCDSVVFTPLPDHQPLFATPPAQDAGTGVLHANAGPTPEQQDRDWRATRPHAAPMACSTCYGTGYGVDCKPCPSGCRAIANSGRTE